MQKCNILWVDDEIDLLKPHILFLQKKGYHIKTVNSGIDAIEECKQTYFDIILLDENMPGISGLETLNHIKSINPNIPVVMITKSEEEYIMDEAIGSKIADYLIKPINPNQILLSIKKILDKIRIISERTNLTYQQDFQKISTMLSYDMDHNDWIEMYKKLVYWDLEIDSTEYRSMKEVFEMQKVEVNIAFIRFIKKYYREWFNSEREIPILSHQLLRKKIFPLLEKEGPLFLIIIDNLRYDQWKILEPKISDYFNIQEESPYYCILPTTTAYARNAIFSGLMPYDMARHYPKWWSDDNEEGGKNNFEHEFLQAQLKRLGMKIKTAYFKVIQTIHAKNVFDDIPNMLKNKLNVIVYNFIDMLSHARTDTNMVRELAPNESAYRSITRSWFQHSSLFELLKILSEKKINIAITTDHGTMKVRKPTKIVGDKGINTNLRYKQARNLSFNKKEVFAIENPQTFLLPQTNLASNYVFATGDYFFVYPNNYNYYVKYYKDTFQHGGISLEEMIVPFTTLTPK